MPHSAQDQPLPQHDVPFATCPSVEVPGLARSRHPARDGAIAQGEVYLCFFLFLTLIVRLTFLIVTLLPLSCFCVTTSFTGTFLNFFKSFLPLLFSLTVIRFF